MASVCNTTICQNNANLNICQKKSNFTYLPKKSNFEYLRVIQTKTLTKTFSRNFCFEKKQAIEFRKQNARKAGRYIGSRTANLDFFIRKPKILVYNLEDFLEDWEDNILAEITNNKNNIESLFNCKNTYFIPPISTLTKLEKIDETKQEIFIKNLRKSITVKFRVLKNTIGVFFRV